MKPNKEYKSFLNNIKDRIRQSQHVAITKVNQQLILLYWNIGTAILHKQKKLGWGAKVIDRLSSDIQRSFPALQGFSSRNLKYMRSFAEKYPLRQFVQPLVAQIAPHQTARRMYSKAGDAIKLKKSPGKLRGMQSPKLVQPAVTQLLFLNVSWAHHVILLSTTMEQSERLWYVQQTIENGWSKRVLSHMIETDLFRRQVSKKKISNFSQTLPSMQSDLAQQLLKGPYIFDFINVSEQADERNIEAQLCSQITKFLLELGQGFSFIGKQYHLVVGGTDFYIDLLFYNIKLRCYVVVELKARNFQPEDTGRINFYLNVINDTLKAPGEHETIGILLCKGKNAVVADYALGGFRKPIGIAEYKLTKAIPKNLRSTLPSIADLENELKEIESSNSNDSKSDRKMKRLISLTTVTHSKKNRSRHPK